MDADHAREIFGLAPLEPSAEPEAEAYAAEARARAVLGLPPAPAPKPPDPVVEALTRAATASERAADLLAEDLARERPTSSSATPATEPEPVGIRLDLARDDGEDTRARESREQDIRKRLAVERDTPGGWTPARNLAEALGIHTTTT